MDIYDTRQTFFKINKKFSFSCFTRTIKEAEEQKLKKNQILKFNLEIWKNRSELNISGRVKLCFKSFIYGTCPYLKDAYGMT